MPSLLEEKFKKTALAKGYTIVKGGWPDYVLVKGKKVRFVEVKQPYQTLSKEQLMVKEILQKLNLDYRIYDGCWEAMSGDYLWLNPRTWLFSKVRELSPIHRLVFLYLLSDCTSPFHMGVAIVSSIKKFAEDIQISEKEIQKILEDLEQNNLIVIKKKKHSHEIAIPDWREYVKPP